LLFPLNAASLPEKQQIPIAVIGWTRPGLEPTIYLTGGEHANHYATDVVIYIYIYIRLKIKPKGVVVVEWSRALVVRLSEWCCSVSMMWVQIPSREEQKFYSSKI
jgi:hypothetical protein